MTISSAPVGASLYQTTFNISTRGRGTTDITAQVARIVADSSIVSGLCQVFVQHTSASLMLCENADPTVRRDLETWMARVVPDGDAIFEHQDEGPDDMPAHIRTILTKPDMTIPVTQRRLALGTWQGIYLWEHRRIGHSRNIVVTVWGSAT